MSETFSEGSLTNAREMVENGDGLTTTNMEKSIDDSSPFKSRETFVVTAEIHRAAGENDEEMEKENNFCDHSLQSTPAQTTVIETGVNSDSGNVLTTEHQDGDSASVADKVSHTVDPTPPECSTSYNAEHGATTQSSKYMEEEEEVDEQVEKYKEEEEEKDEREQAEEDEEQGEGDEMELVEGEQGEGDEEEQEGDEEEQGKGDEEEQGGDEEEQGEGDEEEQGEGDEGEQVKGDEGEKAEDDEEEEDENEGHEDEEDKKPQTDVDFLLGLVQGQAASAVADAEAAIAQSEKIVEITSAKKKKLPKSALSTQVETKDEQSTGLLGLQQTQVWVVEDGILKILTPSKDTDGQVKSEPNAQEDDSDQKVSFQCKVCLKEFTNKSSLRFHQRPQADGKMKCQSKASFRCKVCFRKFPYKDQKMEDGSKGDLKMPMKCDICSTKPRMQNTRLRNQKPSDTPKRKSETKFDCPFCSRKFVRGGHLRTHVQMAHPAELAAEKGENADFLPYPCPACNDCFGTTKDLRAHQCANKASTNKEKTFICEICSRKFSSSSGLKRHHCGMAQERPEEFGAKKYGRKEQPKKDSNKEQMKKDEVSSKPTEISEKDTQSKKKSQKVKRKEIEDTEKEQHKAKSKSKQKRQKLEPDNFIEPELSADVEMNEDIQKILMNNQENAEEEVTSSEYHTPKLKAMGNRQSDKQVKTRKVNSEDSDVRDDGDETPKKTPKRRSDAEKAPFECDVCHVCCFSLGHLAYHKVTHSVPSNVFQCDLCKETFLRRNLLNKHMATQHA